MELAIFDLSGNSRSHVKLIKMHVTVTRQSVSSFFRYRTYGERALRDVKAQSAGRKRETEDTARGESVRNKGAAFSLTGLHRDFTAEHLADAIRRLASINGRVYIVPVALRAKRQEVHGTVHQHLTDVRYRQDRRAVAHQPVDPRRRTAVGRAVDHCPGVVRELHARARL